MIVNDFLILKLIIKNYMFTVYPISNRNSLSCFYFVGVQYWIHKQWDQFVK